MVLIGINPKIPIILIILYSNRHSVKDTGDFNTCLVFQTSDSKYEVQRPEMPVALNKYTTNLPVLLGCYIVSLVSCFMEFRAAVLVSYERVKL
jgi:hypothetical protein